VKKALDKILDACGLEQECGRGTENGCSLHSSSSLCSVERQFLTDVSWQPIGPNFRSQAIQTVMSNFLDCLTREYGEKLVVPKRRDWIALLFVGFVTSRKSANFIYVAAAAWNHASYCSCLRFVCQNYPYHQKN